MIAPAFFTTTIAVKLFNVFLRSSSLLAKFGLILFLSKYLPLEDVGYYGVFAATIVYGVSLVGLEFYTYSTRELLSKEEAHWKNIINNSICFYLFTYIVILPTTFIIFYLDFLPLKFAIYFYPILIFEHVSLELNRLYIALSKNILASFLIFFRTSFWVAVLLPCIILFPEFRNIEVVLIFWCGGAFISCLLGLRLFVQFKSNLKSKTYFILEKANYYWALRGVKYSIFIFLSSQAVILIYTLDKYYLKNFSGLELVSAYILFLGISNALISFLESAVFVFYYPRLISAFAEKDQVSFDKDSSQMKLQVLLLSLLYCILVYLLVPILLSWINKDIYVDNISILVLLLCASGAKALGMTPHYLLYATRNDKFNNWSNFTSLIIFMVSLEILSIYIENKIYVVAYSLTITFVCQLIFKAICWRKAKDSCFNY